MLWFRVHSNEFWVFKSPANYLIPKFQPYLSIFYISLTGDEVGSSDMGLWTCTLCAKYKELRGESGAWFYRYFIILLSGHTQKLRYLYVYWVFIYHAES